jgi:hypothetical protein
MFICMGSIQEIRNQYPVLRIPQPYSSELTYHI